MDDNILEYMESEQRKVKKRTVSFILGGILLGISALLTILYNLLRFIEVGLSGQVLGVLIGTFLLPAVVLLFIFRSKSVNVRANGLLILAILMLLSNIGNYAALGRKVGQNKATEEALNKIAVKIVNGENINDTYSESEYGENAEALTSMKELLNNTSNLRNDFRKKVEDVSEYGAKLETYSQKSEAEAYLSGLNDLKTSLADVYQNQLKISDKMREIINKMHLTKNYKDSFIKGFEESVKENESGIKEFLQMENDIIDSSIETTQFLLGISGKFEVNNGQFIFKEQKDLDKFEELQNKVIKYTDKEKAWLEENSKRTEQYKKVLDPDNN